MGVMVIFDVFSKNRCFLTYRGGGTSPPLILILAARGDGLLVR